MKGAAGGAARGPSRWKWVFWGVAGIVILATLYSAWAERRDARNSPLARAGEVRVEVRAAQVLADTCLARLAVSETRFQEQARRTEALQGRIRQLEALDARGVPADSYPEYLETVERFNASIEGWEIRGGVLEDRQRECRGLVEARNALADSLRGLLVEAGYLPDIPADTSVGDTAPPSGSF